MDEPPLVKTAAHLFRRYCYKYRDSRTAGIICAGWDKREGGQVWRCTCTCMYNYVYYYTSLVLASEV